MVDNDDLWDLEDEALEAAFKEAKAAQQSPETEIEDENSFESVEDAENATDEEVASEDDAFDGHEQPDSDESDIQNSDHNSEEEGEEEPSDDPAPSGESDSPDQADEQQEESSTEEDNDSDDSEQPVQSYKFRANGKEYEFSSDEIVDQFPKIFGQAMDYTKKMQAIKPWRKTIDAIEGAKLSHDDVNLMIDVLKGDKGAISEVLKRTGVDTFDLSTADESDPYVANDYGRSDSAIALNDVLDEIKGDVEYGRTHSILGKEWDDASWDVVSQNPEMIRLLHTDVKSGMYDTLQPLAEKLKVYDGGKKSDLDYYKAAAQQHFSSIAEEESRSAQRAEAEKAQQAREAEEARKREAAAREAKRTSNAQASAKRKAAAPTRTAASRGVVDYLDDSDEAFEDWYKKLQDSL